ncbi:SAS6-like protein [Mya arenaria]|uniref:SAS6-like protein n=1 Tax=Mya arenaria TaxID=6604 RepID=A0ABY7FSE5_MYAAR|nr:SAS6-like protein [Mya arenaria]
MELGDLGDMLSCLLTIELDNLKAEWTAKLNDQMARHKQELATEKERAFQLPDLSRTRIKMSWSRHGAGFHNLLETRFYEEETSNKDLTERRYKNEAAIRDLKSKLATFEEENGHLKQDVQSLRKQNASLDGDYHEQEKVINQLRMRVAVLEQELKDKEQSKSLQEKYDATVQKLEECRDLLKTNENVIQWLNKQINETQLHHQRPGTFEMPTANFRPSGSALHNYSTSSYGSGVVSSHGGGDGRGVGVGVPRPYNPHKPQSGLPLPSSLRNGAPPIPEEIRPTSSRHSSPGSNHSNQSAGDKEKMVQFQNPGIVKFPNTQGWNSSPIPRDCKVPQYPEMEKFPNTQRWQSSPIPRDGKVPQYPGIEKFKGWKSSLIPRDCKLPQYQGMSKFPNTEGWKSYPIPRDCNVQGMEKFPNTQGLLTVISASATVYAIVDNPEIRKAIYVESSDDLVGASLGITSSESLLFCLEMRLSDNNDDCNAVRYNAVKL